MITQTRIDVSRIGLSDPKNLFVRLDIHSHSEDAPYTCLPGLLKGFREVVQLLQMSMAIH
jgi:hypothetical protein